MSAVITRGKTTRADLANWDGKTATHTRLDASGGTVTGLAIGNEVDVLQVFGDGSSRSRTTIATALNHINTTPVTLVFAPGVWTIDASLTIPSNFTCHVPRGCVFNVDSGQTLTFSGPVYSESSAFYSGSGTTVLSVDSIVGGKPWIARTAAEIAAGVTPVNYAYYPGHAYRYATNTTPGTTDMTTGLNNSLLQAYQTGGAEPFWPAGTMLLSTLAITSPVSIRTEGYATILQQSAVGTDVQMLKVRSSDVRIGLFTAKGQIGTDPDEFNHAVILGGTSAISRIKLEGIKGQNIRGDVLYFGGTPTFPLRDVEVGPVNGTNIYRNVVSFVGCSDVRVKSITGTQIGYRLFDVEPNAGTNESPTGIHIGYVRGSNIQFAGDAAIPVGSVQIDYCELDNDLHADSTPGYPTHPSAAGNIPVIIGNTEYLRFGTLKVRNYGERVINDTTSTVECHLVIDYFDVDDSNDTEAVFKTLVAGGTLARLDINGGVVVLQGSDRYICKDVQCSLKNLRVYGGCIAASADNCEFENITFDGTGVTDALFSDIDSSIIKNFVAVDASSATLMSGCQDNFLIGCSGTFSAVNSGGGINLYAKCTLNGVAYELRTDLQGSKTFDPADLADGAEENTNVTVSGAALGDFAMASMSTDSLGVKITAQVTATDTVTVNFHNKTGTNKNIASGTLRARVWKA